MGPGAMSGNITLRQLRAFQAVMTTGSVTAAAEKLHLTQPALSKQLTGLEDVLGLRLFHRRSGMTITPTHEGVAFYKAIEATLENIENLPELAEEVARSNRRRLRFVSTPPLLNSPYIMSAVKRFGARFPDVRLALEQRSRLELEDWVTSRQVDLAFALLPSENPLTMGRPCVETEAVAVVAESHPLASRAEILRSELARERLILPNRQPLRYRIDAMFPGQKLDVVVETTSSISLAPTAATGIGVGICEPFSPPIFTARGIRVLSIRPAIPLTYGVLLPRGYSFDPLVDALIELIKEETAVLQRPPANGA